MSHTPYHLPVLLTESVDGLVTDVNGIYVDGTLGGGGHSTALLQQLGPAATLYGLDQDDDALAVAAASPLLSGDQRFHPVKGNFGFMDALLHPSTHGNVSGILLDLGVSSHQIDEGARGFSFQADGPLDMRMNAERELTAYAVVNAYSEDVLKDIFYRYGEERHSARIARQIVIQRPIESTWALKKLVEKLTPGPHALKSVARIFQAIRIEVNKELDMLERVLEASLRLLAPGGRLVVIAYHSLEDRPVKLFMRSGNLAGTVNKDFYGNDLSPWKLIARQPIVADEAETRRNPRSRSAKLRIAEKREVIA